MVLIIATPLVPITSQPPQISWYPTQVSSIFAPFQGTTFLSLAVELTARVIMAVVLVILPVYSLYLLYRTFSAQKECGQPSSPAVPVVASTPLPISNTDYKEMALTNLPVEARKDPLLGEFGPGFWKATSEDAPIGTIYTPEIIIDGIERYLFLKRTIQKKDTQLWDVLFKEAENEWKTTTVNPYYPQVKQRWKYSVAKPIFFHAFINARITVLASECRYLSTGTPVVTAAQFAVLRDRNKPGFDQTEGIYNLQNQEGYLEFSRLIDLAIVAWKKS